MQIHSPAFRLNPMRMKFRSNNPQSDLLNQTLSARYLLMPQVINTDMQYIHFSAPRYHTIYYGNTILS